MSLLTVDVGEDLEGMVSRHNLEAAALTASSRGHWVAEAEYVDGRTLRRLCTGERRTAEDALAELDARLAGR